MNLPIPDKEKYLAAKPFPHCVIDNVFDADQLRWILSQWPYLERESLRVGTTDENRFRDVIASFIKVYFHSQKFIFFLEKLSGIKGLVLDCREIGLHEIFRGGNLDMHLDYTINETTGLQHRVNAILYLNEKWLPSYNGYLELQGESHVGIEPIFNRIAIFNIDEKSWHGCPSKLNCPEGMSRKSIALNYFTAPQTGAVSVSTIYRKPKNMKYFIRQLMPPFLFGLRNKFRSWK